MLIEDPINLTTTYGTVKKTDGSRLAEDDDEKTTNSGNQQ